MKDKTFQPQYETITTQLLSLLDDIQRKQINAKRRIVRSKVDLCESILEEILNDVRYKLAREEMALKAEKEQILKQIKKFKEQGLHLHVEACRKRLRRVEARLRRF